MWNEVLRSDKIIMVIRMKWEELNVLEFSLAVKKACGVVLVPIGCLEKHGNHMPIGTDIILAREISLKVSMEEDVMVFPFMPFGVVGEVKHKLGTISLSSHLLYQVLEELCDELGYASNIKEYKKNPENFKGNVSDVSTVIRVSITSKSNTPDLYHIIKLLGKERIIKRINKL